MRLRGTKQEGPEARIKNDASIKWSIYPNLNFNDVTHWDEIWVGNNIDCDWRTVGPQSFKEALKIIELMKHILRPYGTL